MLGFGRSLTVSMCLSVCGCVCVSACACVDEQHPDFHERHSPLNRSTDLIHRVLAGKCIPQLIWLSLPL